MTIDGAPLGARWDAAGCVSLPVGNRTENGTNGCALIYCFFGGCMERAKDFNNLWERIGRWIGYGEHEAR